MEAPAKVVLDENTVFHILSMIRNFYLLLMQENDLIQFGLKTTSRIKNFVFKFISVPEKVDKAVRTNVLNIYTE